jgi:hypothetical protein
MKTTSSLKSTFVVILLGITSMAWGREADILCQGMVSMNSTEYVKDPTLCNGVGATWDATTRKFTVKGLHGNINEPWIAYYLTDRLSCSSCYVDICPYGTYIPGASTFSSFKLDTAYGDPFKGGTNGSSNLYVAIKSVYNDSPKCGGPNEDCGRTFSSNDLRFGNLCEGKTPTYCENYNATFSGSIINVSGINNCSPGNMFMLANPDFSKWLGVSIKVDSTDIDKGSIDVSKLQFYQTTENVYPYPVDVMFIMLSNSYYGPKGGVNVNECSKLFSPYNPNSISNINTNSITISPNPATSDETITIKGEYASDAKVSIASVSGQTVGSVIPSVGTDAMTVSLSELNLQAGIYFIRIESGEKVFSGKLCVK